MAVYGPTGRSSTGLGSAVNDGSCHRTRGVKYCSAQQVRRDHVVHRHITVGNRRFVCHLQRDGVAAESSGAAVDAGVDGGAGGGQVVAGGAGLARVVDQAGRQVLRVEGFHAGGTGVADQRVFVGVDCSIVASDGGLQVGPGRTAVFGQLVKAPAGEVSRHANAGQRHALEGAVGRTGRVGVGETVDRVGAAVLRTKQALDGHRLAIGHGGSGGRCGAGHGNRLVHKQSGVVERVGLVAVARQELVRAAINGAEAGGGLHRPDVPAGQVDQVEPVACVATDDQHLGLVGQGACHIGGARQGDHSGVVELQHVVTRASHVDAAEVAHAGQHSGVGQVECGSGGCNVQLQEVHPAAAVHRHHASVEAVEDDRVVACTGKDLVGAGGNGGGAGGDAEGFIVVGADEHVGGCGACRAHQSRNLRERQRIDRNSGVSTAATHLAVDRQVHIHAGGIGHKSEQSVLPRIRQSCAGVDLAHTVDSHLQLAASKDIGNS